jgi:hypothetical protein
MTRDEQSALKVVMNFLNSYAKRDIEGLMVEITSSKPILVLGTNDNEIFKSIKSIRAAFKKDFENMNNIRWGKRRNLHVKAVSTLASVIIELPISYQSKEEKIKTLFRYALTLTKERGKWKICSGMASVPFTSSTYSFPE